MPRFAIIMIVIRIFAKQAMVTALLPFARFIIHRSAATSAS
jgi:hypothetical protein